MPRPVLTFARFVATPENRAAWLAVQDVAAGMPQPGSNNENSKLLMLHGPAGSGKSHLVHALAARVTQERRDLIIVALGAADLSRPQQASLFAAGANPSDTANESVFKEARHCDLLMVEDLQYLNARAAEDLAEVIDYLQSRGRPVVVTANTGPQRLEFRGTRLPARLTNRLAAGLVVGMEPLGPASRLTLLQTFAQRRQLAVPTDILRWLAECLSGGGRQLESAITRLEALAKGRREPLNLQTVQADFREETEAGQVTMERIAARVGGYYRVNPGELQSSRRSRDVLLPRQVSMYLARRLTQYSLREIGEYFGGRDHSTVLHACQKVEKALDADAVLSGAVREIHAALA